MIAALAVPVEGQLVCVGGTGAVVTPLPGCVVPGVTVAFVVEVFPVVVGVVLALLPPETQATSKNISQQLIKKSKKR